MQDPVTTTAKSYKEMAGSCLEMARRARTIAQYNVADTYLTSAAVSMVLWYTYNKKHAVAYTSAVQSFTIN